MRRVQTAVLVLCAPILTAHAPAARDAPGFALDPVGARDFEANLRIQTRYLYNRRDEGGATLANPDSAETLGFVNRRVNVDVRAQVAERLRGRVRLGMNRGTGQSTLEFAYAQYDIAEGVSLRAGLIRARIVREEHAGASNQLAVERSAGNETFNQGFAEGVDLSITRDRWRAFFSITDGFGTSNTSPVNPSEADFAASARVETRLGGAPWNAYAMLTSFPDSEPGVMLGAALSFQHGSDTNPAAAMDTTSTLITADASVLADGWNLYASALVNSADRDTGADLTDLVLLAQGGVFISERDELFLRWNGIYPDADNAPRDEPFRTLTGGWNHYLIPGSQAAKFSIDAVYAFDPTTTSIVRTGDGHNLLPDARSGQLAITAQFQILF